MVRTVCAFAAAMCLAGVVGVTDTAFAQHHHGGHHGASHHGGGHIGFNSGGHHGAIHLDVGHGGFHHGGHHSAWAHVVPSYHRHVGVYYSYGGASYYTPLAPPVTVQVLRPALSAGAIVPPPPPTEPIAPQSVKLEFGGFQQTEDLASRLEIEANRWCLDLHYNYSHNPDFATAYRQAYKVLLAAKYAHSAEHAQDRQAIRGEAAAAEMSFHEVQAAIANWTRIERRIIGAGDLAAKTATVEAILHHLLYDVGVEATHGETPDEQAPPPEVDVPPALSE